MTCGCISLCFLHHIRFVHAGLAGLCRREVILEYFSEDARNAIATGSCCDVCMSKVEMVDAQDEITTVLKTVMDLPGHGEKKVRLM